MGVEVVVEEVGALLLRYARSVTIDMIVINKWFPKPQKNINFGKTFFLE